MYYITMFVLLSLSFSGYGRNDHGKQSNQWGVAVVVIFIVLSATMVLTLVMVCVCHQRKAREEPKAFDNITTGEKT